MAEKKDREQQEKSLNDQQAVMWKKDKELFETEEKRLQDKIKGINSQNADFLNRQVADKKMRVSHPGMNKNENQYNRGLLKMINNKRKTGMSAYDGASRAGAADEEWDSRDMLKLKTFDYSDFEFLWRKHDTKKCQGQIVHLYFKLVGN